MPFLSFFSRTFSVSDFASSDAAEEKDLKTALKLSQQKELKLKEEAENYGFECKDVAHDGACFYSALADQMLRINQKKFKAADLRLLTQQHIQANKDIYRPFLEENIDQFIKKIGKPNEWVDHVEIMALSRELETNIVILRSDAQKPTLFKRSETGPSAFVGYEVGSHYQSLIPQDILPGKTKKNIHALIAKAPLDNVSTIKGMAFVPSQASSAFFPTNNIIKYGMLGLGVIGLFAFYRTYKGREDSPATLLNNVPEFFNRKG